MERGRVSVGGRLFLALVAVIGWTGVGRAEPAEDGMMWLVSPMAGWDRNELEVRGPQGRVSTERDTGPEYGLYMMMAQPRLVVNNFLFFADVNGADVWGDLLFANYYHDPHAAVTWNVGAGYLYHEIEPEGIRITVKDPMVKVGPLFRVRGWHAKLNPYVGYAWERVETTHGDRDNDSYLYGVTVDWRWRMLGANVKYYYQDSQEIEKDFETVHVRLDVALSERWSLALRADYMEHQTTTDTSVLLGPACAF